MSNLKAAADSIYIFLADEGYLIRVNPVSYGDDDLISGKLIIAVKADDEGEVDEMWAVEVLEGRSDESSPPPNIKLSKKVDPSGFGDNILEILQKMNQFNSSPLAGTASMYLRGLEDEDEEISAFISVAFPGFNIDKARFGAAMDRINQLDQVFSFSSVAMYLDSLPPEERERVHREAARHAAKSMGLDMPDDEMDNLLSQSDDLDFGDGYDVLDEDEDEEQENGVYLEI